MKSICLITTLLIALACSSIVEAYTMYASDQVHMGEGKACKKARAQFKDCTKKQSMKKFNDFMAEHGYAPGGDFNIRMCDDICGDCHCATKVHKTCNENLINSLQDCYYDCKNKGPDLERRHHHKHN